MKSLQLILAATLLFSAGVVAGVMGARLQSKAADRQAQRQRGELPPPLWARSELLRRVQRDLDLSETQRERIEELIRESQESLRALWEPVAPRARSEMESLTSRIRQELDPAQQERFDAVLSERSKRFRMGPPGDRGPRRGDGDGPREDGPPGRRSPRVSSGTGQSESDGSTAAPR